jgi:hypothetical protein
MYTRAFLWTDFVPPLGDWCYRCSAAVLSLRFTCPLCDKVFTHYSRTVLHSSPLYETEGSVYHFVHVYSVTQVLGLQAGDWNLLSSWHVHSTRGKGQSIAHCYVIHRFLSNSAVGGNTTHISHCLCKIELTLSCTKIFLLGILVFVYYNIMRCN